MRPAEPLSSPDIDLAGPDHVPTQDWKSLIEDNLDALIDASNVSRLNEAMRHALLAPGKRIRPLITLATAQRYGASSRASIAVACAVECIHTASLILDDLPCMDDAAMRRGRATTHVAFGESTAVLAAIGLIGLAFEATAASERTGDIAAGALTRILAEAMGTRGLAAGQYADLSPSPVGSDVSGIRRVHGLKTGALFAAAAEAGAIVGGADEVARAEMRSLGLEIGLMFQQLDDVADAIASKEQVGKDVRRDAETATIVELAGTEAALAMASTHMRRAFEHLEGGPRPDPLADLLIGFFGPVSDAD